MPTVSMRWIRSPDEVADRTDRIADGFPRAALSIMNDLGIEAQAAMVAEAPWTDRTGLARKGLRAVARDTGGSITLTLYHSMAYGIFLELKNGGRYAILIPVQRKMLPVLQRRMQMLMIGVGFS